MAQNPENGSFDTGYTPTTDTEELEIEVYCEPWERYDKNISSRVFYPICIGEVLDQRYRIEHKLGHGGFSTVWMAHDIRDKKDVALKVMASGESGEHDYQIQQNILQNVQDTSHLVTYISTFMLRGDQCDHRVLVFPLQGECLDSLTLEKKSMAARMSAARQLLEALGSLHKAGIAHRDLTEHNCMWGITLDNLSLETKYKVLGRPLKQAIPYAKLCKPGELVVPMKIPGDLRTETFYLGDFGLAMKLDDALTVPQGLPPAKYCSPERLHNQNPSLACDMWSYTCIFAELYLGFVPFSDWCDGGILTSIVGRLGPLPKQWKGHYNGGSSSLDSWYDHDKDPIWENLEALIARIRPETDPVERQHALSIMSRGFIYLPEKRITATQLLQDPSFKAIMDKYCG